MSNTIGDMVVAITGDTTNFNLSIDAAGKKLDILAQITAKSAIDMTSSFKKIDNEVALWGNSTDLIIQKQNALKNEMTNLMAQGFDPMSPKIQSLKTQYSALGNEALALEKSQISLKNNLKEFSSMMTSMGIGLTAAVTLPILGIVKASIESSAQMEMLEASFTTFLGSASQASTLMNNLIQMAAKTPFVTTDLASGAKMLLQYGIAIQDIIPDLRMLGDVSSGNTEIFNRLVYAFGQINSTGRLMGQDLRQMTEAGFNPLYVISEKTGESFQSLQKRMAAGGIAASEVVNAFKIATSEGGKFFQGMERGSLTFNGLVSTLKDNVGILGRSMSDQFIPTLKDIIKWLSSMTQWITGLDSGTKIMIITMGVFAAATGPVVLAIGLITNAIITMDVATKALMISSGGVLLAIGAVVAIIALIGTKAAESKKQLDDLAESYKGTSDPTILNNALTSIEKQIKAQKDLIDVAKTRGVVGDALIDQENKLTELTKTRDELSKKLYKSLEAGSYDASLSKQKEIEKEDEWTTKRKVAEASLASQFALIDEKQKAALVTHEEYNASVEKRKVLLETIDKMLKEGFTFEGAGIQNLIEDNLSLMNGEEARFQALSQMGQAYLDEQLDNNNKIANAEQAKNMILEQQGLIYINRQVNLKAWVEAVTAASAKESATTVDTNVKINAIETKSYSDFESIQLAKGKLVRELGVLEVDATKWANDRKFELFKSNADSVLSVTTDLMNSLKSISDMSIKNQLDALDASTNAALEANDKQLQDALIKAGLQDKTAVESAQTQLDTAKNALAKETDFTKIAADKQNVIDAQAALKKAQIEQTYADNALIINKKAAIDKYNLEKKEFETNKLISIAQATISGVEATMKAYATLGWPLGLITAGIMAGISIAQVGLISQQQPPAPPALAQGGIVMPSLGGSIIKVAEAGKPEVIFPLEQLDRFISNGFNTNNNNVNINDGNINLIVNLDSKPFLDKIFPATKNRTIFISQGAIV